MTKTTKMTKQDQQWLALHRLADAAGRAAAEAARPIPMLVGQPTTPFGDDLDPNKPIHFVSEGVCGFAWVKIRPATCSFARWLIKNNIGRVAYNGGVDIWISDYNQSMERKEEHAHAYARVIAAALPKAKVYADSRMD